MSDLLAGIGDDLVRLSPDRTWYLIGRSDRLALTPDAAEPEKLGFFVRMLGGWYFRTEEPAGIGISLGGRPVRERSTVLTENRVKIGRTTYDLMPARSRRSGYDEGALARAIRSACPRYADLELLLARDLYVELYDITPPCDMRWVADQVIRTARENDWLTELLAAIRFAKPEDPALDEVVTRFDEESIVDGGKGFIDPLPFAAGLLRVCARVCRIEVNTPDGRVGGTGFLVGPDLVLTSRHVVEQVLSGGARPNQVICMFDYHSQTDLTASLRASHGLAVDWRIADVAGDLDFALLRLAGTPGTDEVENGERRDWFHLLEEVTDPAPGVSLVIPQHPRGLPLKAAIGDVLAAGPGAVLVTHKANTMHGSSGSPCFTFEFDLVAMHRAGWNDNPAEGNAAVPIRAMLRHLRENRFDLDLLAAV